MTEKDIIDREKSRANVIRWKAKATDEGLNGYFRRHDSEIPMWREIRATLRKWYPVLCNFGEHCEFWEFPVGDVVIYDPSLAVRVEEFFMRQKCRRNSRTENWYLRLKWGMYT